MLSYETILFTQEEQVALLTLNRPERRNAFTHQMLRELTDAVQQCAANETIRAVLIGGAGKGFCAGQDLSTFGGVPAPDDVFDAVMNYYKPLITALTALEKPVIAAIQGAAAGAGVSLALACDLRIMAEDAYLMLAFSNIGLVPDAGVSWFMVRHLGYSRAFQLAAEAERLDAARCLQMGLANRIAAADDLHSAALAWAHELAARPTRALGMTKKAMLSALHNSLEETIAMEAQMQALAVQTRDHQEGVAAFLQHRTPAFSGQ
ncbi:MAG: enoyl-CoA hydratase-related protein [Caldilineaceae bacterium]